MPPDRRQATNSALLQRSGHAHPVDQADEESWGNRPAIDRNKLAARLRGVDVVL